MAFYQNELVDLATAMELQSRHFEKSGQRNVANALKWRADAITRFISAGLAPRPNLVPQTVNTISARRQLEARQPEMR